MKSLAHDFLNRQEIGRKIFVGLQMKRCEDLNEIVGKKIRVQVGTRQNREKNKKENAVLKYLPMEDVAECHRS